MSAHVIRTLNKKNKTMTDLERLIEVRGILEQAISESVQLLRLAKFIKDKETGDYKKQHRQLVRELATVDRIIQKERAGEPWDGEDLSYT